MGRVKSGAVREWYREQKSCREKVTYALRLDADLDIARLWIFEQRNLVKYKCDVCRYYHLTHGKWKPE